MILLFIGPSGSGKDTQAEILSDKFGFKTISSGDLLRKEVASNSELGKELETTLASGKWVDDKIVFQLVAKELSNTKVENIILTGVVRTESQIELLDEALKKSNKTLDRVVYFQLSDEEAVKRLSGRLVCPVDGSNYHTQFSPPKVTGVCDQCGGNLETRSDDKPEAIKSRLLEFERTVLPILDRYTSRGQLINISAAPDILTIHNQLIKDLGLV